MQRQSKVWQVAARAGITTFVLCLLLSANVFLPYLAQLQDFGHNHSENTPQHTHQLDAVFTVANPAPRLELSKHTPYQTTIIVNIENIHIVEIYNKQKSRAPPSFT